MLPLVDKPAIQYIIEEAVDSGIEDILIITGRHKRAIEDHFDRSHELESHLEGKDKLEQLEIIKKISSLANIHYVRQSVQKGLGDAVLLAKSFVGIEPFAVLLGDDIVLSEQPALSQLITQYNQCEKTVIGVQEVAWDKVSSYGVIDGITVGENVYQLKELVEKPNISLAPSNIAIIGRYIVNSSIFEFLEQTPLGKNDELQLTDALNLQLHVEGAYAYAVQGKRYDIGDKISYIQATLEIALSRQDIHDQVKRLILSIADKVK